MTNFEFWKNELEKLTRGNRGNVAIVKGKPRACNGLPCKECDRLRDCFDTSLVGWLLSEHVEKTKLTKKERLFCELVETGWIARDKDGVVYYYKYKPYKHGDAWDGEYNAISIDFVFKEAFPLFIKWEDEEPWSIEELLKLEVE